MTTSTTTQPRVYVGTYGKYNNGSIAGKWLDLSDYENKQEFLKACAELHKDEHDPEFMFQDYEGFPASLYSESYIDDKLFYFAQLSEDEQERWAAYYDIAGSGDDMDIEDIEERIMFFVDQTSHMSTEEQLGYHMYENGVIEIPDHLVNYFDFEAYGRDCMMNYTESDSYVFDMSY